MTASVWLAPMIPKLPLPLAQRIERLLQARPGRETQEHALKLCEAIVAYAACIRASVAVAVVPAARRAGLSKAIGELREAVERGEASIANFRDLLVAAAEAIEALEPGHPLGRSELTRSRTAWVARTSLVEALGDTVAIDEAIRTRAIEGGIVGIIDLWVALVEARRSVETDPQGDPWLAPLGDLIVDTLGSAAVLGEASLTYPERARDGGLGELRVLHGLESEPDAEAAEREAYEPGVVCWRFGDQVVSSCGLLSYWTDEHEFEHVGVIARQQGAAEYLDYGSEARSPAGGAGAVVWDRFRVREAKAKATAERERSSPPVFVLAAAAVALLLVLAGIAWAVWPTSDAGEPSQPPSPGTPAEPIARTDEVQPAPKQESAPEVESEIVIETEPEPEALGLGTGGRAGSGDGAEALADAEGDLATAPIWFESERNLGICQITYDGKTRNANLHLKTRAPEGPLEFSYRCGEHRGRGTIDVKRNRVNGVLFCKKDGAVTLKTVRTNEGRCDR
jgi:hypothetical protein